ncbi:ATP-grasp domain-containing protein [Roseateles sp. BYS96W]|uniref:Acetyl-CoA carboxylase biotin carboxylase subunit family protein n=1 Tax=Pelomonas nitida TaxID=3299027 RepID=A0ABW7GCS5_9BURK
MYFILNPNGKQVRTTLDQHRVEYVEVREGKPAGQHLTNAIWVSDAKDVAELSSLLAEQHYRTPLRGIFSVHESTMLTAALLRMQLGLPGTSVDETLPFVNKLVMKQRWRDAGLPCADSILVDQNSLSTATRPKVLKPILGASCIGTHRYDIKALSSLALDTPVELLVMEDAIDVVAEFHVDTVRDTGVTTFVAASQYLRPPLRASLAHGSCILRQGDPHYSRLIELSALALDALGAKEGVFHLEILLNADGELLLGEVARRPGGSDIVRMIELESGLSLMAEHIRLSLRTKDRLPAQPPGAPNPEYRTGRVLLRVQPGRVAATTSMDLLRGVSGVVEVAQHLAVGDLIDETGPPFVATCSVMLKVRDLATYLARAAEVESMHGCKVIREPSPPILSELEGVQVE